MQVAYIIHPYLIGSCAARTTTVLANLLFALFLLTCLQRKIILASFFLAFCTYQSVYPIMLIVPLILMNSQENLRLTGVKTFLMTVAFLLGLFYLSYLLMGNTWTFVGSTWGFILSVPELTPNMGLFWYFFTEMFEHFRLFFVCTFQINCFVYVIPLAAKLKNQVRRALNNIHPTN